MVGKKKENFNSLFISLGIFFDKQHYNMVFSFKVSAVVEFEIILMNVLFSLYL